MGGEKQDQLRVVPEPQQKLYDSMRRDILDTLASDEKGIYYLLVAHGAGFAGCLAVVKDYATTPQLKGLGAFINLFGYGFLVAGLAFVVMCLHRSDAIYTTAHYLANKRQKWLGTMLVFHLLGLLSFTLLAAAIGLICSQLSSL